MTGLYKRQSGISEKVLHMFQNHKEQGAGMENRENEGEGVIRRRDQEGVPARKFNRQ